MDPKSTAKSKRSHTLHGRRTHENNQKKKPTPSSHAKQSLPSNWDRYDTTIDNDIIINQETKIKEARHGEEAVIIKSKGADFGYLIEQAKSQHRDLVTSETDSALHDFSYDFMQGVSSMLSVRGKGLVSLCRDDNFVVDDDTASNNEVPFLTMDLHALAAQLSKLKLSQRLFIEEDILSEEMDIEELNTVVESKESEISEAAKLELGFDSNALLALPVLENTNDHISPHQREIHEPTSQITSHNITDSQLNQNTRFEASVPEAELDILLCSLNDISLSDTNNSHSVSHASESLINVNKISIDDSIDDLLAETSLCFKKTEQTVPEQKHTSSIDDLLAETSSLFKEAKQTKPDKKHTTSVNAKSNTIGDATNDLLAKNQQNKELNDFDSWLETL